MLQVATNNLDRAQALFDKGWITKAQLDDAIAQHDRNEAAVAEAEKRIIGAKLPGRSDMIDAAAANAEAARHALTEAEKNLGKRQGVRARGRDGGRGLFPAGRSGECRAGGGRAAAAAQSQGSVLRGRAGARARFRSIRASRIICDGCPPDLHAKINFIAREAEFTPPVIFSREQRQKLVYLIEARPEGPAAALTAGQPVTVTLGPGEQMVRR